MEVGGVLDDSLPCWSPVDQSRLLRGVVDRWRAQRLAALLVHFVAASRADNNTVDHYQHDWQFPGLCPVLCHDERRADWGYHFDNLLYLQHLCEPNGCRDGSSYALPFWRLDDYGSATPGGTPTGNVLTYS